MKYLKDTFIALLIGFNIGGGIYGLSLAKEALNRTTGDIECIEFSSFQDSFKIEVKQVHHKGGIAYYVDKDGKVLLIRPENKEIRIEDITIE